MQAELTFSLVVDGCDPIEKHYKGEDGKDNDFCEWMQEARMKLSHWMKAQIDTECK